MNIVLQMIWRNES